MGGSEEAAMAAGIAANEGLRQGWRVLWLRADIPCQTLTFPGRRTMFHFVQGVYAGG